MPSLPVSDFLHLGWHQSFGLSALLALLALGLRLADRLEPVRSFAREFAIILGLFGLWQFVGHYVRTHSAGAMERAQQIQDLQSRLHLPSELELQKLILPHEWLVQAMNDYYAGAHLTFMTFFLLWVWWRRRPSFHSVRNTVAGSTLIYLLVQSVPVAPPRLLPGAGYVDTALLYNQSVYGPYTTGLAAQLTAMPSVHVGWSFIIAWYVHRLGRGPLRWAGVVHLVLTLLVVAATANHWWLDGIVAIAIAVGVLLVLRLISAQPPKIKVEPEHSSVPAPVMP